MSRLSLFALFSLISPAFAEPSDCDLFAERVAHAHCVTASLDEEACAKDKALLREVCNGYDKDKLHQALPCLEKANSDAEVAPCLEPLNKATEAECRALAQAHVPLNLPKDIDAAQLFESEAVKAGIERAVEACTGHLDRVLAARSEACAKAADSVPSYAHCLEGKNRPFATKEDCQKFAQTTFKWGLSDQQLDLDSYLKMPATRTAFDRFVNQCEGRLLQSFVHQAIDCGSQAQTLDAYLSCSQSLRP